MRMTAAAGSESIPITSDEDLVCATDIQNTVTCYTKLPNELVAAAPPPRFFSPLPLKWVLLLLLVFQNAASTILVTHTRSISPLPGRPLYLGSVAVLVSECLKLVSCLAFIASEEGGVKQMVAEVWSAVVVRWRDTIRMAVPALCYGLQNMLFYVALSNLTPTAYQLWSQSKTLVTALFFVTILKQVLKPRQWFALGLLTAGVALVQVAEVAAKAGGAASAAASAPITSSLLGVAAVLASSVLSGFANIYFEKVLKEADVSSKAGERSKPASLWIRNVQQGLFAIPQAAHPPWLYSPWLLPPRTHPKPDPRPSPRPSPRPRPNLLEVDRGEGGADRREEHRADTWLGLGLGLGLG